MNRQAEHLVRESRRLPPIHVALSFLLATFAALTVIGIATRDASTKPHPQSTDHRAGGGAAKSGETSRLASAMQQLTVVPVLVAADGAWNSSWASAQDAIGERKAGGVMLVAPPTAKPLSGAAADQVGENVTRLREARGGAHIGLAVIAAMDGLFENEYYCSEFFPGAKQALIDGIRGDASALRQGLEQINANALLAVSLKDDNTGCAGGGGASPTKMVGQLQNAGILYIARGAILEQKQETPWATTYVPAASPDLHASRLWAVVASSKPREQPGRATWRYQTALDTMHRDARRIVIATPDLSAPEIQSEVDSSPKRAVVAALKGGADLPLWSGPGESTEIIKKAHKWWQRHTELLFTSCERILRAKRAVFHASDDSDRPPSTACEPGA